MVAGASMVTVEAMAVMAAETMAVAEVLEIAVVVSAARMVQELEDAEGRDMVDVTGAALETSMKAMQVMQVVAQTVVVPTAVRVEEEAKVGAMVVERTVRSRCS